MGRRTDLDDKQGDGLKVRMTENREGWRHERVSRWVGQSVNWLRLGRLGVFGPLARPRCPAVTTSLPLPLHLSLKHMDSRC